MHGYHQACGALPAAGPYLPAEPFPDERFARQYRCELSRVSSGRPARALFTIFYRVRQACSHSNPSQKIKVRSAVHP
ncbi:unnamed protein product [Brassica napus]|uniref:(rape) hypothetical protein n=1 Tax=Brassica napus TaxID=3708 RepID=A0A816P5R8_BRANA|nr:unnamed protein product [Brassica napus]